MFNRRLVPVNIANKISRRFQSKQSGILDRLAAGPVIGDGGFVFALEKRGYVRAGPWTPEATLEYPNAVKELHREFARSGSDVMQTFTFYASEDKLQNRGNYVSKTYGVQEINDAACVIAREVADEYGSLVAGGVSQTPTYLNGDPKESVQSVFKKQCSSFARHKVDFMIAEYFEHVEECVWAVEAIKESIPGGVVAANLCISADGDMHGVSTHDCALRLAEAGAEIIGLNCHFDPFELLKGMEIMKLALEKNGIDRHLMVQPLAFWTPDVSKQGFIDLPEFPFALEPRIMTRWDMHKFARQAWEMGIRYIGGCCGFEPYHIRAIAQELQTETERVIPGDNKHEQWGGGLEMHTKPWVRARASKEYWSKLNPSSGRPFSSAMSRPDCWGVTQGNAALEQHQ